MKEQGSPLKGRVHAHDRPRFMYGYLAFLRPSLCKDMTVTYPGHGGRKKGSFPRINVVIGSMVKLLFRIIKATRGRLMEMFHQPNICSTHVRHVT